MPYVGIQNPPHNTHSINIQLILGITKCHLRWVSHVQWRPINALMRRGDLIQVVGVKRGRGMLFYGDISTLKRKR